MKQTRAMSVMEATARVVVRFGLALVIQIVVYPLLGLHPTLAQNVRVGVVFTGGSMARSFALRRAFERLRRACDIP